MGMRMFRTLTSMLFLVVFLYMCCGLTQLGVAAAQNKTKCIERERQALLDFKHGLDHYDSLSSWGSDVNQSECCNWLGVHCNNNTGHVTVLDLSGWNSLSGRKVSPSLLELKYLNNLDLSGNDFQGSPIPEFIASFRRLRVLSLRDANFFGTIPPQLGNLTNLHNLNIGGDGLKIKNVEWLSLLSSLRSIDLSGVHFDLTPSPVSSVSLSPFLEELHLPSCGLIGALPFSLNSSHPFLSIVDLSYNNLSSSSVFYWLRNGSKQLTTINLSQNNFTCPIPDVFQDMKFLENLDLHENSFTGGIPKSFGNLTQLQTLALHSNELNESIVELFEKLSKGAGGKLLQTLDLSLNKLIGALPADTNTRFPALVKLYANDNQLSGSFPLSYGLPSSLIYMDLSGNKISGLFQDIQGPGQESDLEFLKLNNNQIIGQFPDLSHFPSLRVLDLSDNRLQGGLPETIGKLSNLRFFDASSNSLEGVVTEAHFSNLTCLSQLDLSNNAQLSFNFSIGWVPPFQLDVIQLANCKVGPQFPKWLQTQTEVSAVDISSSGISSTIPHWFWNLSTNLGYLNLSHNNISHKLPADLSTKPLRVIDLSYNNFSGLIPVFPQELQVLYLSNNKFVGSISFLCSSISVSTEFIDLSYNQLFGVIPDCWNNSSKLKLLDLGNNNFFGKVPHSLGSLVMLQSVHLRNNYFTGELPSSLQNCTSLRVMDFGVNEITGRIPSWIGGSLTNLVVVSLRQNKLYGSMPSTLCHLNSIQILDLSRNNFSGKVPQCFNNFTSLVQNNGTTMLLSIGGYAIEYSDDYIDHILIQWKNKEWEYKKQLGLQKSIDLSSNQLSGHILEEFSSLKGLISLNLSRNYLTGKIFEEIYQMKNLESLDLSVNKLSGEIPKGLAHLSFLAVLDLSNNFLSGKIPTSTQLQSFNAICYAGNNGLCGDPLPKCPQDVPPQSKINDYQEGDDFPDRGFYISMVLGFSLSFWGFMITLVLKDSWRSAYYEFLNDVKDLLYVKMKIYLMRLLQKFKCAR